MPTAAAFRALVVVSVAVLAADVRARADWSPVPLKMWTEGKSFEVVAGVKPPYGDWKETKDELTVEGKSPFWSTRLLPGDQPDDLKVQLQFTLQASNRQPRQLPGGGGRWAFYWGENFPGWDVGVVLRWKDPLHFYRVQLSGRGELALWDSTGGFLQLVPCKVAVGQKHTLDIETHGAHFIVKLDGQSVLDYWDRTAAQAGGQVGLAVFQSKVLVSKFDANPVKPDPTPMPAHKPNFRVETSANEIVLFDGLEPISQFAVPRHGFNGVLFQQGVKLRPGWRPAYYTWIGPGVNGDPSKLVGKFPEALRVEGGGDRLVFRFETERPHTARAKQVCTVRFDAERQVYRYEYEADVKFIADKPLTLHYFELADPLTFNNRSPGPDVVHRWNGAGHQWNLFEGPGQKWQRYPLLDYLGPYNEQVVNWGKFSSILYPDPGACPTFEFDLLWDKPKEDRHFRIALCLWGYDFHYYENGAHQIVPVGAERRYKMTLTARTPEEGKKLFDQSAVAPRVLEGKEKFAVFDPRGNTFDKVCTRAEPTSTMVWTGRPSPAMPPAEIDEKVGRTDQRSLRIDGPDEAGVHLYDYMIERQADRWWLRGWFKSKDVAGRGFQVRVKYSYARDPEDVFYVGAHGDKDWTYFSFITRVPKHADSSNINFELDGTGSVWIDDVAFSALKDKEEPATTSFPMSPEFKPRTDVLIDLPLTKPAARCAYDASYNGNSLLLRDVAWITEDDRTFLRFDGKKSKGTLPLTPGMVPLDHQVGLGSLKTIFPLKEFSYEFWFRPQPPAAGTSDRGMLFHFYWNPVVYVERLPAKPKHFVFSYQNDMHGGQKYRAQAELEYGAWYHCVAAHGGGKITLYLNGKNVDEMPYDVKKPGFEFFAYHYEYTVGNYFGGQYYTGDLGPFRVYATALTADQAEDRFKNSWRKR